MLVSENSVATLELSPPSQGAGLSARAGASPHAGLRDELARWRRASARQRAARPLLIALDLAVLIGCFIVARTSSWIYNDVPIAEGYSDWLAGNGLIRISLFLAIAFGMVAWLAASGGHYTPARRKPWWDELRQLFAAVIVAAMFDAMIVFLGKWQFSRLWVGSTWLLVFALMPFARLFAKRWMLAKGCLVRPYVLVGDSGLASEAAQALASEPLMAYRPVALVSPDANAASGTTIDIAGYPLLSYPLSDEIVALLKEPGDYQIVVALDADANGPVKRLLQSLMITRDDILVVPPLAGLPLLGMELSHFFSHEVLLLRARNNLRRRVPRAAKRAFDLVGATSLLILLAPLFAWVALRIRLEAGGPVIFAQQRVGFDGQPFRFYKFRSMVPDADTVLERWQHNHPDLWAAYRANNFKLADDPRVTRVGRWIRRTSIDELPQLWNVLLGDMSLVGPRPLLPRELPEYGESIEIYRGARPGITGLWQISGRSLTTFDQRIAMDRWYLRNWSLWYDLVILVRTLRVVLRGDGAH